MALRSLAPTGALLLAFAGLPLTGCDSGNSSSEPATLRLNVESMVGANAFQAGQPFAVNGTTGQLDVAQMYLSGITLLHEDGREIMLTTDEPVTVRAQDENQTEIQHTVDERYVLVDADAGETVTTLGEVPAGRYTGVRFLLGVDGLDNRAAMEDFPAGHPLATQTPSMHWNWNAGYVFLRLDGLLDIDGDGAVDAATGTPRDAASGQWRLHVGGTPNAADRHARPGLRAGGRRDAGPPASRSTSRVLVQGIDYADPADRFCMTGGCQAIVDQAKANTQAAFTLRGVHGPSM